MWGWFFAVAVAALYSDVSGAGAGAARLVCYSEGGRTDGFSECTHLVYGGDARGDKLDALLKEYRKSNPRLKIIVRVGHEDKDLRSVLKSKHVQGLELHEAHKSLNRTKVVEAVDAARAAIAASGGGPLFLALPAHPELLAKYYDLRSLVKKVDLMMVQTHALGVVKKMTYHPSRLSGLWDMMNTDSVVDLVVGLGIPASKVVISLPATARQFHLLNETLSTPGSPTVEDDPKEIDQAELCRLLQKGRWTLERDQDLSAPYAFKDKTWMSFEDSSSVDVKGKYARVRGLAGLALHQADNDVETPCGPSLKAALAKVLNQQSRAPRAAVLRSLEHEILSAPGHARPLDALQVSPYRITQIVDSDGVIHSIREDTRTEFSCSRQGYFVHPRSCARFYRCVKFDQLSPEYTVFEFDCPAGLAFDSRYEVCVWPGSLPDSQACPGSSEIAPVPRTRFTCPDHEGYYADPENCRWFFACLDHGTAPLTAYEFRCPFGLGFDAAKLTCEWPWLVPACGNIARYEAEAFGFGGAALTGATGFHGQTANAVNVAAHRSLVSGASLDNLVGIQNGFLSQADSLDSNFIASQELANSGQAYQLDQGFGRALAAGDNANIGLVQPAKYTSGSLILDDYRLPTQGETNRHGLQNGQNNIPNGQYNHPNSGFTASFGQKGNQKTVEYQSDYDSDNSGAYVHDPTGDYAEPYKHIDGQSVPYVHSDSKYNDKSEYYDYGRQYQGYNGQYIQDNAGAYVETGPSNGAYSGSYANDNSGTFSAGVYNSNDDSGKYSAGVYSSNDNSGKYNAGIYNSNDNSGKYSTGVYNSNDNSGKYSAGVYNSNDDLSKYSAGVYNSNDNSGKYTAGVYNSNDYSGKYSAGVYNSNDDSGKYSAGVYNSNDNSGKYSAGVYNDNSGQYVAGVYREDGHIGNFGGLSSNANIQQGYSSGNLGYLSDSKAYTGSSHTLTNGAVNVGLVGKTRLVDATYNDQFNYNGGSNSFGHEIIHAGHGHVPIINEHKVSISHLGTDGNNLDGYSFVTTPTASVVPTTATPFAVTTAIPVTTYKTTYVPEIPKTDIKAIFGYSQPAVTYVQPTVSAITYTPNVQITDYNQGVNYQGSNTKSESSGYVYSKPNVKFEDGITYTTQAPVVVSTFKPQGFSHSQHTLHNVENGGYQYSTSVPVTEEPFKKIVAYTTGPSINYAQPTVASYVPQSFSHQTIHKVESKNNYLPPVETGYEYSKPAVSFEQPQTVIEHTTAQPVVVSTYAPQGFSHQTLHKVDASQVNAYSNNAGYNYEKPSSGYVYTQPQIKFKEAPKIAIQYSTASPVLSTYKPQSYSHQTIHKIETQNYVPVSSTPAPVELAYNQPAVSVYQNPILKYIENVTPTTYIQPAPQSFSHQTIHIDEPKEHRPPVQSTGYTYEAPKTVVEYTTAQPVVTSTYQPQVFHQTLHKVEANKVNTYNSEAGYHYEQPIATSTYRPQVYSHQTIHQADVNTYSDSDSGYKYEQPALKLDTGYHYEQPIVTTTYKPQVYSHQTLHKVEASKVNTYSNSESGYQYEQSTVKPESGYQYEQPAVKFEESPKTVIQYTTQTPEVSTYKPQSFSHQTYHNIETQNYIPVSSTPAPKFEVYHQPAVTVYQNPILKFTENVTPAPTYTPIVQQHEVTHVSQPVQYHSQQNLDISQEGYSYSQPEIQRDVESYNAAKSYSDASLVSHQVYHQYNTKSEQESDKNVVFVSSTPSTLVYEDHYADYESPKFKVPEYIPPKNNYQSFSVSTAAPPVVYDNSFHTQDQYAYQPTDYSQNTGSQVSFSTSHVEQPRTVESVHFASVPEIQVEYKAEEYIPPVVSTTATPIITSTYRLRTHSTPREYLPPTAGPTTPIYVPLQPEYNAPEYLPPKVDSTYLPPSTTARPRVKSTTLAPTTFKVEEYLPPSDVNAGVVNFESFGFKNNVESNIHYNAYPQYVSSTAAPLPRKNIVVETFKTNLLGFGTVGPDAGLVPVTYTTGTPISSTYLPPVVTVRKTRPRVKSTTQAPEYLPPVTTTFKAPEYLPPVETTTYKAQEYLPPVESENYNFDRFGLKNFERAQIKYNPYKEETIESSQAPIQRKQNIVIQTAKANLLGFGTVGSDAGLVSEATYSTAAPIVVSSESYSVTPKVVTYAPIKQELVEVTPVPVRRTKPKVAVVTKINDFNPLLVRKLGAVCSCQSPVLILKGRRPNVQVQQDFDDYYSNDYEDGRGDIADDEWAHKAARLHSVNSVTSAPIVKSTFNPIIVPDDSFYQDFEENVDVTPKSKQVLSQSYVSSTPVYSSTQKVVKIRPRVKAVTAAPTYKTVVLNQEVAPEIVVKAASRGRDDLPDCQRAGLFRHPKQCNKFYACRWDCNKQKFTVHTFNCPVQLSFDPSIGACNWPSQGPACQGDTLLTNTL